MNQKNRKRWKKFLLPLLAAGVFLTVHGEEQTGNSRGEAKYYVYYLDRDEAELVPVSYEPQSESSGDLLQNLMLRLNEKQTVEDYHCLFPDEVRIDAYSINENRLDLQMNDAYLTMPAEREILTRAGLVFTLQQVPGIVDIRIFIGENELQDSTGEAAGTMSGNDFIEQKANEETYRYDTFTLYFTDREGTALVEESRSVYYRQNLQREQVIMEQLIKGPMEEDHYPTIPENTSVGRIVLFDRVCHVDLGAAFSDYALDIPAQRAIESVVRTLIASGSADQVQISIDGDEHRTLDDGAISLYQYFS